MKKIKLKSEYEIDDLPEPFMTSPDLVENAICKCDSSTLEYGECGCEDVALRIFNYLEKIGAGVIYTQVDSVAPNHPDVIYSRGIHSVNKTGVYAFVFGSVLPEECEGCGKPAKKGWFYSGYRGIIAHITKNGRLGSKVERCDMCERYRCDNDARKALVSFLKRRKRR